MTAGDSLTGCPSGRLLKGSLKPEQYLEVLNMWKHLTEDISNAEFCALIFCLLAWLYFMVR